MKARAMCCLARGRTLRGGLILALRTNALAMLNRAPLKIARATLPPPSDTRESQGVLIPTCRKDAIYKLRAGRTPLQ
eukprot:885647-Pyramimonas_sp.AAC.1